MCFSCFGFHTLFVWNHICFTALSCEIKKNKSVNENLLVHFNVSKFSVCMATNQLKIKCLRIWHTFIIPLSRQESSKVQKSTTGSAEKLLQWHKVEIYTLRKRLVCTLLVTLTSLAGVFNCFLMSSSRIWFQTNYFSRCFCCISAVKKLNPSDKQFSRL